MDIHFTWTPSSCYIVEESLNLCTSIWNYIQNENIFNFYMNCQVVKNYFTNFKICTYLHANFFRQLIYYRVDFTNFYFWWEEISRFHVTVSWVSTFWKSLNFPKTFVKHSVEITEIYLHLTLFGKNFVKPT